MGTSPEEKAALAAGKAFAAAWRQYQQFKANAGVGQSKNDMRFARERFLEAIDAIS